MDERFGNPSSEVRSGAIDFAVVFAREGTTAMCTPAAVSVYYDLTASKSRVSLWTADDEEAGRLDLLLLATTI